MDPTRQEPRGPARIELAVVEKGVDRFARAAGQLDDRCDRRAQLAEDRAFFAAERTYSAWVRTGLMSLVCGIGAWALLEKIVPGWFARSAGTVLILGSTICFFAAVWRYLAPGAPLPPPNARRLSPLLLIVLNGFLVFVAAAVLVGLWSRRVA